MIHFEFFGVRPKRIFWSIFIIPHSALLIYIIMTIRGNISARGAEIIFVAERIGFLFELRNDSRCRTRTGQQ